MKQAVSCCLGQGGLGWAWSRQVGQQGGPGFGLKHAGREGLMLRQRHQHEDPAAAEEAAFAQAGRAALGRAAIGITMPSATGGTPACRRDRRA
jgi:hypothetical protein